MQTQGEKDMTKKSETYEVQHYAYRAGRCIGWANIWTVEHPDGSSTPETFETEEAAQAALDEMFAELEAEIAAGQRDPDDTYDRDEFRIAISCYCEHHETVWNGIAIAITYEPDWLNCSRDSGLDTAHLEIRAISPEGVPLPITETGYRSHFTNAETVASYGGPVAFVLAWLDEEANTPAWRRRAAAARQLSLF
jgi:hypothetical protein